MVTVVRRILTACSFFGSSSDIVRKGVNGLFFLHQLPEKVYYLYVGSYAHDLVVLPSSKAAQA
jgi:hypothetical protein